MTVIFVLQPPRGLLLLLLLVIGVVVRPFSLETTSQRPTAFPNSVQVQPEDIDTFIRQTGQLAPSKAAIGIPATCNCRHGFAQAFAMDPFPQDRLNSGLLKLTCPHLVRAVDALEDDNMIGEVNKRLETSDELQSAMEKSHKLHATTRNELLDDGALQTLQSKLGQKGTQAFLESGVAGASQGGNDVKVCLFVLILLMHHFCTVFWCL